MEMTNDLLSFAQDVMKEARANGADAADVLAASGHGTDIELREGNIEKMERDEGTVIGLRVFVGKSSAITSGNVMSRDAARRLVENAIAMARLAPADPFAGIAEAGQLAKSFPNLDLASERVPEGAELHTMARTVEEAALAVPGITKSGGASASSSNRSIALVTSNGFAQEYKRTGISISVSAIAGEGTGMERDYDYSSAIHLEDLRSAHDVGTRAGERAVRRMNPRKIASCQVPVIYDRRVASSLLGHLAGAINGSAIARGTSFLKESLSKQILPATAMVWDDPLRPRGFSSRPFDGEGLAVSRRAMIEKGTLTGWYLDLRSSRQLNMAPTGNAARGSGSPPSPTSSNLHIEPGKTSREAMIRDLGRGLLVTEMMGASINMVNGDYSRGASGFWIENGELAYPVSEITIAGNLKDIFLNMEPADDLEFTSSTNAPSIRVEGLTIAGR